jgi:hypothetical protein
VDGKTLRGATQECRQVHLLAAMEHASRRVLAQREVDGAPGEVPGFQPLLAQIDLAGAVVTADALQTHAEAAEFLVAVKHAHYLFCLKANLPMLLDRCQGLARHHVPVLDRTRDQAHGRVTIRTLKAVNVSSFGFPHAAQAVQSPARPAPLAAGDGGPRSSTRSPASPSSRPAQPGWPTTCAGTGRSRRCTSAMSPSPKTPPTSGPGQRAAGHGLFEEFGHRRAVPGRTWEASSAKVTSRMCSASIAQCPRR